MTRSTALGGLALLVVALAGCGEGPPATTGAEDASPVTSGATTPAEAPAQPSRTPTRESDRPVAKGTAIVARQSHVGTILFDDTGQAVYVFDVETSPRPRCYGACAEAWPPVLTKGPPRARGTVQARLLGTTERRDGARQVTYRGSPLYYYAHEGKGEVECHDVFLNGGTWYAVQPDGRRAP